jgi:hypothetical protein
MAHISWTVAGLANPWVACQHDDLTLSCKRSIQRIHLTLSAHEVRAFNHGTEISVLRINLRRDVRHVKTRPTAIAERGSEGIILTTAWTEHR